MCLNIDESVTSLPRKRTVWKIFDKRTSDSKIASLFQGSIYPKNKMIERSHGETFYIRTGVRRGTRGLHFYTSKAKARAEASTWYDGYIAKFEVDPADFMFAGKAESEGEVMYERAKRVGNFIKVSYAYRSYAYAG